MLRLERANVRPEMVVVKMAHCALMVNVCVVTSLLVIQHQRPLLVISPTVSACVEQVLDARICQQRIHVMSGTTNASVVLQILAPGTPLYAKLETVQQQPTRIERTIISLNLKKR